MKIFNYQVSKLSTRELVICALMAAVGGVLSGALSIPLFTSGFFSSKISLGLIPTIFVSLVYGPFCGALTGITNDLVNVFFFARGAYNPFFTLTAMLVGIIPAIIYRNREKISFIRVFIATMITYIVCSFFLNTLWIYIFYGSSGTAAALFYTRIGINIIMIPIASGMVYTLMSTDAVLKTGRAKQKKA